MSVEELRKKYAALAAEMEPEPMDEDSESDSSDNESESDNENEIDIEDENSLSKLQENCLDSDDDDSQGHYSDMDLDESTMGLESLMNEDLDKEITKKGKTFIYNYILFFLVRRVFLHLSTLTLF